MEFKYNSEHTDGPKVSLEEIVLFLKAYFIIDGKLLAVIEAFNK